LLTDTRSHYGLITIVLHWLGAAAMLYLWFGAPDDQGGRLHPDASSHIALGSGLALLLLARIAWRLGSVNPAPLSPNTTLNVIASIVKALLLVDTLVIVGTGFCSVWFKGNAVSLFGGVPLPNLVGTHTELAFPTHILHSISTNLIFLALLGLHVLGAVKHLVWDRDGTFSRMLWPRSEAA